jgi:septum site-determining protein MinC
MSANSMKGAVFAAMVVQVKTLRDQAIGAELADQVGRAPGFFAGAPVILDLADCTDGGKALDYLELRDTLRRFGLMPVGVRNASMAQQQAANDAGLASFPAVGSITKRNSGAAGAALVPPRAGSRNVLVTQPVRSGTQIYARGGDVIVLAPVSAGAEVIADGHVHIYGTLRGRAVAGASGDEEARIFVDRLEAELVCIAGRYLVSEAIPAEYLRRPGQIALIEDRLRILPRNGTGHE